MPHPLALSRRACLAAMALPAAARASSPETAALIVPGPEGTPEFRWLQRLAIGLGRALPQATLLRVQAVGGPDGVTAANRFATLAVATGQHLVALAPGATQARLVGDSRARYDPAPWLAVCGAAEPCALLVRRRPGAGAPLRLALPGPASPAAAALLALDLLGMAAEPVFVPTPEAAFREGAVDAFLATGPDLPAKAQGLQADLVFAAEAVQGGRMAELPETPTMAEARPPLPAPAMAALGAAFAAQGLHALVLLPPLTPADAVAGFRRAAASLAAEPSPDMEAMPRLVAGHEPALLQARLVPGEAAAAFYRSWLAQRLHWRAA